MTHGITEMSIVAHLFSTIVFYLEISSCISLEFSYWYFYSNSLYHNLLIFLTFGNTNNLFFLSSGNHFHFDKAIRTCAFTHTHTGTLTQTFYLSHLQIVRFLSTCLLKSVTQTQFSSFSLHKPPLSSDGRRCDTA